MSHADRRLNSIQTHSVSHYEPPDDVLDDVRLSTGGKRVVLPSCVPICTSSSPSRPFVKSQASDEILSASEELDEDTNPRPRGGLAMRSRRRIRFVAQLSTSGGIHFKKATQGHARLVRMSHKANDRRCRKVRTPGRPISSAISTLEKCGVNRPSFGDIDRPDQRRLRSMNLRQLRSSRMAFSAASCFSPIYPMRSIQKPPHCFC